MTGRWPHTGAILAGGRSSRMGTDKSDLVLPDGRTMVDHVQAALESVCARVVVVGGDRGTVRDLHPGSGPLAGIEALLASGLDEDYLVCPCDLPLVTPDLLSSLLVETTAAATALRVEVEPEPRPLPARISAVAMKHVRRALARRRLAVRPVMRELEPHVIEVPTIASIALTNVNTPEEFEALTRLR